MMRILTLLTAIACAAGCSERLSNDALSRAVAQQKASLDACYDTSLQRTPDKRELHGQALLVIEPSGKVSSAIVEGDDLPKELVQCLHDTILGWTFPEASGATKTSLPLIFKPQVVKVRGFEVP